MLNPMLIFLFIVLYGLIVGYAKGLFAPRSIDHLGNLLTGVSVAVVEEYIFRHAFMYLFLMRCLMLEDSIALITSAAVFSISHFLAGMYKKGVEYSTDLEFISICSGLFLFGCVTGKYFLLNNSILPGAIFHALSIFAVQTLTGLLKNEGEANKWLIDNGHQFIRLPYAQAVMILFLTVA